MSSAEVLQRLSAVHKQMSKSPQSRGNGDVQVSNVVLRILLVELETKQISSSSILVRRRTGQNTI